MSTKTKSFLKSKTFWFNVASGVVLLAQGLAGTKYVPNDVLVLVIALGNVALRIFSDTKLTLK